MPWLIRDSEVLAALEVAETRRDRTRGLLGRDGIDGGFLIRPARQVHTFGMRFAIDVAFCTRDLVVVSTICMPRNRVSRVSLRGSCIIEAEAGAFERWRLRAGDELEIRE
ncbi:MAG TPA: DUF192 domain-containing protein [Acidimicrobiales bacterium]|nr:DUF192 domain-containing protein [Acidimicrobiales bacterium]